MSLLLFCRSRGLWRGGIVLAATWGAAALVPSSLDPVPGFDQRNAVALNAATAMVGALWAFHVASPGRALEETLSRFTLIPLRLVWLVGATVALLAASYAGGAMRGLSQDMLALVERNVLLGVGLGTVSGCLLPRRSSWAPVTIYVLLCWFMGTQDVDGTAQAWALPQAAPRAATPAVVVVMTWVVGALFYAWRDGHPVEP